jgi:hypothetical protein
MVITPPVYLAKRKSLRGHPLGMTTYAVPKFVKKKIRPR